MKNKKGKYTITNKNQEAWNKQIKQFQFEENQKVWNQYENNQLANGRSKVSIAQYKPAALALERVTNKQFKDITAIELDSFINSDVIRNTSHVRGFLISVISDNAITVGKDVLAYLIPIEYKKLVELLIK